MAGMFHDIGKISIPDAIIEKPGKLTALEYETIQTHTEIGYQILRAADQYSDLAVHALSHHERWDGKGYPSGLKGEQIPLYSRIIGIADAFEAMTGARPYKKPIKFEQAIIELKRCSGSQFDSDLVKVFIEQVLPKQR
jgi:HD-GYP domain-containing protein (c-di-GMP phosphodiesterase class II)